MEKVQGIRSIIRKYIIDGDVKNSMGNGETKELTRMTHEYELSGWIARGNRGSGWRGAKKETKKGQW